MWTCGERILPHSGHRMPSVMAPRQPESHFDVEDAHSLIHPPRSASAPRGIRLRSSAWGPSLQSSRSSLSDGLLCCDPLQVSGKEIHVPSLTCWIGRENWGWRTPRKSVSRQCIGVRALLRVGAWWSVPQSARVTEDSLARGRVCRQGNRAPLLGASPRSSFDQSRMALQVFGESLTIGSGVLTRQTEGHSCALSIFSSRWKTIDSAEPPCARSPQTQDFLSPRGQR